jgi:4-aminobutyrate aminotransferase/(S)-3-amino-2-methylpropionate transaminase
VSLPEQRRRLVTAVPGPRSRKLQEQRDAELARGLGVTLPVFVERAGGGIIVDVDGNHIVDLASGIAVTSVGASDPDVVRRVTEQAERFTHTCFLVTEYEGFVDVAAALNRLTPGEHAKRTALFTTGAEAVENAVKIARVATGRRAVVVLGHAYHGRTLLTMTMTARNVPYKEGFGPFAPEVYRVPSPYPFRWTGSPGGCAEEALDALRDTVLTQIGAHNVAAVLGGGLPISAVTGRAELMDAVPAGGLGGTYAGNPVACAAALGVLRAIERDDLVQKARDIEAMVMPRLGSLQVPGSFVGDVRGRGAMLAVELVEPGTTSPSPGAARQVAARCHAQGVLVLVCGTYGNVIRLLPPLVIDHALLDDGLVVLEAALRELS